VFYIVCGRIVIVLAVLIVRVLVLVLVGVGVGVGVGVIFITAIIILCINITYIRSGCCQLRVGESKLDDFLDPPNIRQTLQIHSCRSRHARDLRCIA
jgi:hypothetical protein